MDERIERCRMQYNQLLKEQDDFYYRAGQKGSISETAFWIMYWLFERNGSFLQSDLSREWYYSKQTINSAVKTLVNKGYVSLLTETGKGNRKVLRLTEAGRRYCEVYIGPLLRAEREAFGSITEEERQVILTFMQRQLDLLKRSVKEDADPFIGTFYI